MGQVAGPLASASGLRGLNSGNKATYVLWRDRDPIKSASERSRRYGAKGGGLAAAGNREGGPKANNPSPYANPTQLPETGAQDRVRDAEQSNSVPNTLKLVPK